MDTTRQADRVEHEKLPEAQALLEHYRPEIQGLCKLLGDLVEARDKWGLTFMALTFADLFKDAAAQIDKAGGTSELSEFCKSVKWN